MKKEKLDRLGNSIVPYDTARFDEGYYMHGERKGFPGLQWSGKGQQEQLGYKKTYLNYFEPYRSILFVGCARGFEVRKLKEAGKIAKGIDVSQWAIANADSAVKDDVLLYNGVDVPLADDSCNVLAAFDVLTLVPLEKRITLCREMARVAEKGICIRTIIKDWRNIDETCDGLDGVSFCYAPLEWWDEAFTESGKFRLAKLEMTKFYECVMWFER